MMRISDELINNTTVFCTALTMTVKALTGRNWNSPSQHVVNCWDEQMGNLSTRCYRGNL